MNVRARLFQPGARLFKSDRGGGGGCFRFGFSTSGGGANSGSRAQIHTVNVVTVPSGTFLSPEEIQKYRARPVLLEHASQQPLEQLEQLEYLRSPEAPVIEQSDPEFNPQPTLDPAAPIAQIASRSSEEEENRIIDRLKDEIRELAGRMGVSLEL